MCPEAATDNANRWPLGTMVVCGFPQLALRSELDLAHRLGATHVECYARWSNVPDPREIAQQVSDAGLTLWSAHGPWGSETWRAKRVDLGSPDQNLRRESIDDVRRAVGWLADAGGTCLVVHPGVLSCASELASRREALIDSLGKLARVGTQHEVFICLENMPQGCYPGSHTADNAEIVAGLGEKHIALCLDTGHAHIVSGVVEAVLAARGLLRSTHLHDNDGRRDRHLPPGMGTLPWEELPTKLAKIAYRGPLVLECPRYLRDNPEAITDDLRIRLAELCRKPGLTASGCP